MELEEELKQQPALESEQYSDEEFEEQEFIDLENVQPTEQKIVQNDQEIDGVIDFLNGSGGPKVELQEIQNANSAGSLKMSQQSRVGGGSIAPIDLDKVQEAGREEDEEDMSRPSNSVKKSARHVGGKKPPQPPSIKCYESVGPMSAQPTSNRKMHKDYQEGLSSPAKSSNSIQQQPSLGVLNHASPTSNFSKLGVINEDEKSQRYSQHATSLTKQESGHLSQDFRIRKGSQKQQQKLIQLQMVANQSGRSSKTNLPNVNVGVLSTSSNNRKSKNLVLMQQQSYEKGKMSKKMKDKMGIAGQIYGQGTKPPPLPKVLPDIQEINSILAQQRNDLRAMQEHQAQSMQDMSAISEIKQREQSFEIMNAENPQDDVQTANEQWFQQPPPDNSEMKKTKQKSKQQLQQFPSMLFEENPVIEVNAKMRKKYLVFRVYEDPIQIRPYLPPDRGYYFDLRNCEIKLIRYTLEDNGFRELPNVKDINQQNSSKPGAVMGSSSGVINKEMLKQQASIIWYVSSVKSVVYQSLQRYQKINHFPNSFYITRKDLMYKAIAKMREIHGQKHFTFLPITYILPNEYQYLQQAMQRDQIGKQYIFKPAAQAQGRGIFVTDKLSDIPQKNNNSNYVVSEYISNPLLLNGYKFDMRIYVAITGINPLRIYMYEEGLARFATCKYSNNTGGKTSKYMHLTNYSINKKNAAFQHNKDQINDGEGSKWSLTALRKLMKNVGIDDKAIWRQIEDIIIKTILSAEPHINQAYDQYVPSTNNCFELLGFDILIDEVLQPWLIEVNLSPSLGCDAPLDQKIKGNLMADLFTLIGVVPLEQRKVQMGLDPKFTKLNGMYTHAPKTQAMGSRTQTSAYMGNTYEQQVVVKNNSKLSKKERGKSIQPGDGSTRKLRSSGVRRDKEARAASQSGWSVSTNLGPASGFGTAGKPMSREEQILVKEVEDEFKRRGHFKRIFPSMDYSYYKQFFPQGERPLNKLIDQKVMEKRRLKTAAMMQMQNSASSNLKQMRFNSHSMTNK